MASPPAAAAAPEPAAEPPVAAEGAQLSLKVRTLDQKTYPITIGAAASVPQLKELVAVETGVTLARQRLIYRGRVLKNDQTLASYSLEDGHVLHLVVRAAPPPADSAASAPEPSAGRRPRAPAPYRYNTTDIHGIDAVNEETAALHARMPARQRRGRSPPPMPRDNDEPDPTMGRSGGGLPGRLLMGATISVPEGADVTMPFLSSMIANLVTHVNEGGIPEGEGVTTGTAADGRRHVTFSSEALGSGAAAEVEAATMRALRRHHRNRDGSGSTGRQRHGRRSSTGAERQVALRARTGLRLESVRATLDDASLDFPEELTTIPQGDNSTPMAELQQQVELLLTLVERFGPRLRLLPAALAQRERLSERSDLAGVATGGATAAPADSTTASTESAPSSTPSASNVDDMGPIISTRHVIRAIEALQTIGESTDLLARMARHAFVRQSMQLGEPIMRRGASASSDTRLQAANDAAAARSTGTSRDGASAGDRIQARLDALNATIRGAGTGREGGSAVQASIDAMQAAARTGRMAARSGADTRPRFRVARLSAADLLSGRNSSAPRMSTATPIMTPGSSVVDVVDPVRGASRAAPAPGNQPATQSGQADAYQDDVHGPLPPTGAHISISGMGLPLMSSVVFPFSLAAGLGGSHATTTWNLADFVSRLTSELPISTLYGVMAGDATHLHHILAHIGFALFSGVDVPRVTRPSIRTWAQDLVGELRRLMRLHALPADVLDEVGGPVERCSALGNELLRVVEPFIPDLVDFLVRATSASRAAAFGASSATFLRTMAQQVVRQLRSYARGGSESEDESDARLKRLLRGLLVWLGMNEHLAGFVVDSLLCWTEGDSTSSRHGQTRQRDEADSEAGPTDLPAAKRRREE
ncbi:unnamed protein product [Phytophthora lilii]|uniref:Unnamed protein product n=1 Tax=Phytophthora lilii TaxID=2077276 RepID=A0A9W6TFV1_9STRA|nr:unnamed protein product [Phytophthora lilii]